MKKFIILIFASILIVSLGFNVYLYVNNNRNKDSIRSYYLSCLSQSRVTIANIDGMVNENLPSTNILDKEYEKYFLIANDFKELSNYVALFNDYYSAIDDKVFVQGFIETSYIFSEYSRLITSWAYGIKANSIKDMPTKKDILAFKNDVKRLTKIFQVYFDVKYKGVKRMEDMNYKSLYSTLINFCNSSKLEYIRKTPKRFTCRQ